MEKSCKGHLAMLSANVIWGLNAPIGKAALEGGVTALSLTTFRMVGAAAAFWLLSLFVRRETVRHEDMIKLFFAALFGVVLNQGTFIFGLSLTSPIDASIVTTMTPIVTMIVAALYLREPITGKKVLGIFVGAVGALLLILGSRSLSASGQGSNVWGDLLCLTAQISFAVYLTVFRDLVTRYSPVTVMKWMFVYASMCYIPFTYRDVTALDWGSFSARTLWCVWFVVLGATFVAYLCVMVGQRRLRPTLVSMYNYVQPVVASAVAVVLGMDSFGFTKGAAVLLVFAGVWLVTRSKSRAQLEAEQAARTAGSADDAGK